MGNKVVAGVATVALCLAVVPAASAAETGNASGGQSTEFASMQESDLTASGVQIDVREDEDGGVTVRMFVPDTADEKLGKNGRNDIRPQCYPASTCYNGKKKKKLNLKIGEHKTIVTNVPRHKILDYLKDSSTSSLGISLAGLVLAPYFPPAAVLSVVATSINDRATSSFNSKLIRWSRDTRLRGMKITTVIYRRYTGYETSVSFSPWK